MTGLGPVQPRRACAVLLNRPGRARYVLCRCLLSPSAPQGQRLKICTRLSAHPHGTQPQRRILFSSVSGDRQCAALQNRKAISHLARLAPLLPLASQTLGGAGTNRASEIAISQTRNGHCRSDARCFSQKLTWQTAQPPSRASRAQPRQKRADLCPFALDGTVD